MLQWVVPIQRWLTINQTRDDVASQIAGGMQGPSTRPIMGDMVMPTTMPATQPVLGKPSPTTQRVMGEFDSAR